MKRAEAIKLIGNRVQAWTSCNGVYVGTLVNVIASQKWRGIVKIEGVISPAHHIEFGEIKRRGFRIGEEIEVGGVNISLCDASGTTYLEALQSDIVRLEQLYDHCKESPDAWSLLCTINANRIIIEAEQNRLTTGEWSLSTRRAA